MSWQDILKNIEFDPTESCCSELKNNYLQFIEKYIDYYENTIRAKPETVSNLRRLDAIADETCERVLNAVKILFEDIKDAPKGARQPSWATRDLEKIIDEFESCKEWL